MDTIAFITGANKGIGFDTARLLAAQGVRVLLGARDDQRGRAAEQALAGGGADVSYVRIDVTDPDTIAAAADHVAAEYGRLDILVNNAGIVGADGDGRPSLTTLETMRTVYETNVFGPVAVINAMLPLLRRAPAGRIVNVSSEVGSIASMTDQDSPLWELTSVPYPSSKTALNMITAMYAKELAGTGIKVNAANPGYCATDLNDHNGVRTAEQGAEVVVELATLPEDGPNGILYGPPMVIAGPQQNTRLPW